MPAALCGRHSLKVLDLSVCTDWRDGDVVQVSYFRTPHKPASEGKVSVAALDGTGGTREYYVSVIGAQWIEREDRV
jgi:hypothetical protein